VRSRLAALGTGLAGLLGAGFVILLLGLQLGGMAYRKDCPTPHGTVNKDWSFQWIPIPYLFRPTAPGCAVHTGTRVALNAIGLFPYTENPGRILLKSGASTNAGAAAVYYDGLYAVVIDLVDQVKAGGFLKALPNFLSRERAAIERLSPPPYVAAAHAAFLREFVKMETDFESAKVALANGDQARFNALGVASSAELQALGHTVDSIRSEIVAHRSP
jgi:hypothetical protein